MALKRRKKVKKSISRKTSVPHRRITKVKKKISKGVRSH